MAEKLHAIVHLGMTNTRMKDFFDIWFLCREFSFEGATLGQAIRATFECRGTPLPRAPPTGLTAVFASDPVKRMQWKAFLARSKVTDVALTLPGVIETIAPFLVPMIEQTDSGSTVPSKWEPGGPWRP